MPAFAERVRQTTHPSFDRLSDVERSQLGVQKRLQTGGLSPFRYVPAEHWPTVRAHLLGMSRRAAARGLPGVELAERMTAYTPGETLHLLREPEVSAWHQQMAATTLPAEDRHGRAVENVIFVPCAKTKPWDTARSGLYGAYNRVRARMAAGELPASHFVTISEPLGVVPEARWGDFPQYDNPGLFRNEMLRAGGLMTADWATVTPAGEKFIVPFDAAAYDAAVDTLAGVIARFVAANAHLHGRVRWLSFVGNMQGDLSTHSDMLQRAAALTPFPELVAHDKKAETRIPPDEHIAAVLTGGPRPASRRQPVAPGAPTRARVIAAGRPAPVSRTPRRA